MCGIVGIINGKKSRVVNNKIGSYLRDAIVANSLRGFDSTGIVQRSKNPKHLVYTSKAAVDGVAFVNNPKHKPYLTDADDTAFTFVHNRAATRGSVTEENSHPFQHINDAGQWMIGCHNGTLSNWTPSKEFSVDSDWALSQIAFDGTDAFEKMSGAYTFVWYGEREGEVLNIARNNERPMFVAYVKGEDRMLFASEYMMMLWLADRNGIVLEDDIIDLTPGYLYQFDLNNPREFKKSWLPSFKHPSQQETLLAKLDKIFSTVRKEEKKTTSNVVILPPPKKKGKDKKSNAKGQHYVTADEARIGKHLELNGQVVDMIIEEYVAKDKELWGLTTVGTDKYTCIIRNVDKASADTWKQASGVQAKVVGAKSYARHGLQECALILSRNILVIEADDGQQLSKAIGTSLDRFMEKRNETGSVH
jgi:hypothetical protein